MAGKCKRDLKGQSEISIGELALLSLIALKGPIAMKDIRKEFPKMSDDWVKTKIKLLELEGRIERTGNHQSPVFHAVPPDR